MGDHRKALVATVCERGCDEAFVDWLVVRGSTLMQCPGCDERYSPEEWHELPSEDVDATDGGGDDG